MTQEEREQHLFIATLQGITLRPTNATPYYHIHVCTILERA